MSLQRIKAILLQEFFITKHSLEVFMDLFFISVVSLILFGFVARYIDPSATGQAAAYILMGYVLWEVIRVSQYSMSVETLWNVWSHNLTNMFVTPLTIAEYLFAQMLSAMVKGLLIFGIGSAIALIVFHFDIFAVGLANTLYFLINLTMFGWSTGIIVLAFIFRYGSRIAALSWGLIFLFEPLTAALFPLKVLPLPLQYVAYLFPPTYIFEAARAALNNPTVNWQFVGAASILNIIYFISSLWFFTAMYQKSRQAGDFSKLEF